MDLNHFMNCAVGKHGLVVTAKENGGNGKEGRYIKCTRVK
jgi:hypothetical protein